MRTFLVAVAVATAACGAAQSTVSSEAVVDATEASTTSTSAESSPSSSSSPPSTAPVTTEAVAQPGSGLFTSEGFSIPVAPAVETGPTSDALTADLDALLTSVENGVTDADLILQAASHADARVAWLFADLLRFTRPGDQSTAAVEAFRRVTGTELPVDDLGGQWKGALDFLIGWDLPALEDYAAYKERLYVAIEPGWAPFFADTEATIDWRQVAWGGVFLDDRPLGVRDGCPRGCIPALDDPAVTDAAGGAWLADDAIVFGVTINGESRAYPKHQMETHEMVNDTVGGQRIALPYCTLCGSAQAYFTGDVPDGVEVLVLRTSGLLSRSNKVMFDLVTFSLFDTFTGEAVSGPLRAAGVRLRQATVVASTWGAWKQAHPETTIVAQDGGIGFVYRLDPLGGRDDDGPIFPIGDVDPRLGVQELVIGVELEDGSVVAFSKQQALDLLNDGGVVEFAGVRLSTDGTGIIATRADGSEVAAHEAFWFAWSQFWPNTALWMP